MPEDDATRLVDVVLLWRAYLAEVIGLEAADDYLLPARNAIVNELNVSVAKASRRRSQFLESWRNSDLPPVAAFDPAIQKGP